MDEKELIRNLKSGNQDALKILINKYQNYIYTIVFQILKNKEQAEEITQDVFLKVYQKIDTFEARSKFSTWLFTIAYRLSINQVNKRNITITESDFIRESESNEHSIEENKVDLKNEDELPSINEADLSNRQEIIWNAIDKLNLQQGLVISLFYLQQFAVAEIAEILQISANTVKTHLFRGRNNLKQILLKNFTLEDLL